MKALRPEGHRGRFRKWTPRGHAPVMSQHSTSDRLKSNVSLRTERGNGHAPVPIQRRIVRRETPMISATGVAIGRGSSPVPASAVSTAIRSMGSDPALHPLWFRRFDLQHRALGVDARERIDGFPADGAGYTVSDRRRVMFRVHHGCPARYGSGDYRPDDLGQLLARLG